MGVIRTTISLPESLFAEVKKEAKKRGMSIVTSLQEFLIVGKKKKLANELLEMVMTNPISAETAQAAVKELRELKKGWKWK